MLVFILLDITVWNIIIIIIFFFHASRKISLLLQKESGSNCLLCGLLFGCTKCSVDFISFALVLVMVVDRCSSSA